MPTREEVIERVEKGSALGKGVIPVSNLADGLVGWDSDSDSQLPLNWRGRKKWLNMAMLSFTVFLVPLASSMIAPGTLYIMNDFGAGNSAVLTEFVVSIYLLGFAIGPIVFSPASEIYGRKVVLVLSTWLFAIFIMASALAPNLVGLIFFRLISGAGGSACLTVGGGIIADLFIPGLGSSPF